MKTSTKGLLALMNHEGVVLQSYRDSVGVWTIGVGHTASAGAPKPSPDLKITLKQAVDLFRKDVGKYEARVNKWITVPISQNEFDALTSFDYNTGGIRYRTKSGKWKCASLVNSLNGGDRKKAAREFLNWKKPPEIIGRRKKEQALFRDGNYGQLSTVLVYPRVDRNHKPIGATRMSTTEVLQVPRERPPVTPAPKPRPRPSTKPKVVQPEPKRANLLSMLLKWWRS